MARAMSNVSSRCFMLELGEERVVVNRFFAHIFNMYKHIVCIFYAHESVAGNL